MKCRAALLLSLLLFGCLQAQEPQRIPVAQLGTRYQLVGKLHVPLGRIVKVQGVVVDGRSKGYEGGPNIRVQRLDGRATQEDIQISLKPYLGGWGKSSLGRIELPELKMGMTYEMEGYETGGYVGIPSEAFSNAGVLIQTSNHYFHEDFVVYKAKRIDPISFRPSEFEGQKAIFQGIALSIGGKACMRGDEWAVIVSHEKAWPTDIEGKLIETYGVCKAGPAGDGRVFDLADGKWSLVRFEDRLGREVELRGCVWSMNDSWYFCYRGERFHIEGLSSLPGLAEFYGRPIVIRGILQKAMLPRPEQDLEEEPEVEERFIVRSPSWEPLKERLLSVESPF